MPLQKQGMTLVDAPCAVPPRRVEKLLVHSGFALAGVITVILGPMLPILMTRWSLNDERAGLFFTLQFCGNLLGLALLGPLISRRGYGQTLGLGFILIAMGIGALNLSSQTICLIATAVFGWGLGLVLAAINLWVAETAGTGRATALSIANLVWGVGALACPALVLVANRSHRLEILLLCLAGFALLHAVALASMNLSPRNQRSEKKEKLRIEWRFVKAILILGSLFFLYCGTESAIGGWAAALAKRLGSDSGNLWELAPMLFLLGLLAGRAASPLVFRRVSERTVLILGLMLAVVCNASLLWIRSLGGAAIPLAGVGLGFAAVFPLLVASTVGMFGDQAKRLGPITFAGANLGGATIPWLIGFTSTRTGSLQAGLLVPLVCCLLMIALVQLLNGAGRRLTDPDMLIAPGDSAAGNQ